jgi:GT2 family glycosyltransferase
VAVPRLNIVIPTRNRPNSLEALLKKLCAMSDQFDRILVVDSSDATHAEIVQQIVLEHRAVYSGIALYRTPVASLTAQKNLAFEQCEKNSVVQILDDDVLPPEGYLKSMKEALLRHDLAGISGVTQEMVPLSLGQKIFGRFFGLTSSAGKVSIGGIGSPIYKNEEDHKLITANWLIGCSMWDLSKVGHLRFNENFIGSALFEDVEFSIRVGREHNLAVDPKQILFHQSSMDERPDQFTYWFRFSRNRFEVIKLRSRAPRTVLLWTSAGVLAQIIFGHERNKLCSIKGLVHGGVQAILQRGFL